MKNYKWVSAVALGVSLGWSATSMAQEAAIEEECILTGVIQRDAQSPEQIRLSFTKIEHGNLARCRAKGRQGGLNRLQFAPQPGDALALLDDGAIVRYHYQRLDGEAEWQRIGQQQPQLAKDVRDL